MFYILLIHLYTYYILYTIFNFTNGLMRFELLAVVLRFYYSNKVPMQKVGYSLFGFRLTKR